jgi:hypothetical protein
MRAMNHELLKIHDYTTSRLIREATDRAERDAYSCVVGVQREGEAQAKRRRFLAELGPRRWDRRQA